MQKLFLFILFLPLLVGCDKQAEPVKTTSDEQANMAEESFCVSSDDSNDQCAYVPEENYPATTTVKQEYIPEMKIMIEFPADYDFTEADQPNRRGSFVSYSFYSKTDMPMLSEIQFFSQKSIEDFTKNCGPEDGKEPCWFGDYPTVERYLGQKEAFNKGKDYGDYKLVTVNDRKYFVSTSRNDGEGLTREYTTFIGDTKVDILIFMINSDEAEEADKLFEKIVITE